VPEILELELTRRGVASAIGRRVHAVERTDPLVVAEGVDIEIVGSIITGLDRVGKQLVVFTDGPTVGVHLGMTGRLFVDDVSTIGELAYGAGSDAPRWDRWMLALSGDTRLRLHDPRRSPGWCSTPTSPDWAQTRSRCGGGSWLRHSVVARRR